MDSFGFSQMVSGCDLEIFGRQIDDFDLMAGHYLSYVQQSLREAQHFRWRFFVRNPNGTSCPTCMKFACTAGNAGSEECESEHHQSLPLRSGMQSLSWLCTLTLFLDNSRELTDYMDLVSLEFMGNHGV